MSKVLIIVNAEVYSRKVSPNYPVTIKMVKALTKAIQNSTQSIDIEIIGAADLWSKSVKINDDNKDLIYCPLTIKLPDWVNFPAKNIFQLCIDIQSRRNWVQKHFQSKTTKGDSLLGDLWLPIVLTTKGAIYGEVIGEGLMLNCYEQPIDFSDEIRQSLYNLGYQLLESINATPSIYLLQFKMLGKEIIFDRLWPFPANPAIASLESQQPDLFACHWDCLSGNPITDLIVRRTTNMITCTL